MSIPPEYQDPQHTSGPDEGAFAVQPGQPISFATGQFAGQVIRVELQEIQKADSGRKYARVDRRPLDPPPAIMLRLYHVGAAGGRQWEQEVNNYEEIRNIGMLCGVDLFPVPDKILDENIAVPRSTMSSDLPDFVVYTPSQGSSSSASPPGMGNVSPRASRVSSDHASAPFELPTSGNLRLNYPGSSQSTESAFTYFPRHPFTTPSAEGDGAPRDNPFQIPRRQPMLGHLNEAEPPSDVILRIGNHLVTESSKLTPALVGEKFVEPVLVDYKGKKCFFFVFGDLAVQREGTFIFRYRAFDIYSSIPGSQRHPVLAELYGGPFRVYSTREFPGLEPSTELTRNLAQYGVRVTLRDAERRRRGMSRSEVPDGV
ncbi:hypothetical protein AGABI1DRAFT_56409 [Agaricus bisporus var. burnettii JB137-S8]|uniref:Velvet domain-containing protein n=1 Tax=Agaricus bisporus var. burnettii (strain JB137-S8 / ATCC MYA-4627 / FGSC 10392) TaxID=597362 RepID=K5WZY9_AGABU|nr:uncharacterized protein AGABI1DRAFT_56409 [Agaricus bisporus var. burnettii JB137-S8]EKM81081.1 hypothetical protein AGABI1DRAFT_56409 [Agaricus bisporus var. burnettii JB137-S8]